MTAILGYVDLLAEAPGPAGRERYVERLRDRAESVTALGEQIRHIEQAFEAEHRVKFAVDPAAVVQAVCAQHRAERPDATLRFDAPPEVRTVFADGLLERAVDAVIENALEHHEGTPIVEVRVEPVDDRWVDIVVSGDGPGIPERERQILSGRREITQLDHSMGLGLWVARRVVEDVDGSLRFGDADDGTTVRLRLRRTEASA